MTTIGILILILAGVFQIYANGRNDWILNNKLKLFERAVNKRHRLEQHGKKGVLLKDIDKAMWSNSKMLFVFWIDDMSLMFNDENIKRYVYDDDYEIE